MSNLEAKQGGASPHSGGIGCPPINITGLLWCRWTQLKRILYITHKDIYRTITRKYPTLTTFSMFDMLSLSLSSKASVMSYFQHFIEILPRPQPTGAAFCFMAMGYIVTGKELEMFPF